MSFLRWAVVIFLGTLPWAVSANPMANKGSPMVTPAMQVDISDTGFCREMRFLRESFLAQEPDLNQPRNSPEYGDYSMRCFSPAENLFYSAHQEAQKILGPHAPWYNEISEDFRKRVTSACRGMGLKNENANKAYDHCIESRHKELMGPYEDKYEREAGTYIQRRLDIAKQLMDSCDIAISIKRNQLPRELEFPIAYHSDISNSIPNWLLEKNINDKDWLASLTRPKANQLMHDVLGKDCPGNMVYWVVYKKPEY